MENNSTNPSNIPDSNYESESTQMTQIGVSLWMSILMSFVAAIMIVAFYHFVIDVKPKSNMGVIDLQTLTGEIENDARKAMTQNPNATEADRNQAANVYEGRMKNLQSAISTIGDKCSCNLMIKAAFLNNAKNDANGIHDYTDEVRALIGASKE